MSNETPTLNRGDLEGDMFISPSLEMGIVDTAKLKQLSEVTGNPHDSSSKLDPAESTRADSYNGETALNEEATKVLRVKPSKDNSNRQSSGKLETSHNPRGNRSTTNPVTSESNSSAQPVLEQSGSGSNQNVGPYNYTAPEPLIDTTKYQPLTAFESPIDMLVECDERFRTINPRTGKTLVELYDWQIEVLVFLGLPIFTDQDPLTFNLCACNGSGKDAYVIAPLAVWLAISKVRTRVIITSSSFDQLSSQTESHIRYVVDCVNNWAIAHAGGKILEYKQFHIIALNTRSEIKMFAKDDPGRVEGYHPFPDYPGAEMCVIVNEAKTVEEGIQNAMKRFTGFNRWINISSSGRTNGPFYHSYLRSKPWEGVNGYDNTRPYSRKVTAYECPHISPKTIEAARIELGETSSLFRSIYLSEFTSLEEAVMISRDALDKCIAAGTPHVLTSIRSVGIDLSRGGDETTCYLLLGNKVKEKQCFRCNDSTEVADRIVMQLDTWHSVYGLIVDEIKADGGGLGASTIDFIEKVDRWRGIRRIFNQSPARSKRNFGNVGAEMWFRVKRFIEQRLAILDPEDLVLIQQLGSRYYRESNTNSKLYLESKPEAKAKGHGSPDRADALVLAYSDYDIEELEQAVKAASHNAPRKLIHKLGGIVRANQGAGLTSEQLEEYRFNQAMGMKNADNPTKRSLGRVHSSLSVLLDKLHGRKDKEGKQLTIGSLSNKFGRR